MGQATAFLAAPSGAVHDAAVRGRAL